MEDQQMGNGENTFSRRHAIAGAAILVAGAVTAAAPGIAGAAPRKSDAIDNAELAKRLEHLEQQNEYIISLLEKLTPKDGKGKPLPKQKPDFAKIEKELRATITQPEYASFVKLDKFTSKTWICQAILLYKTKDVEAHWHQLEEMVRAVQTKCNVPGRVSGWTNDGSRITGAIVEFGYSPEVGYDHPNEFTPGQAESN